MQLRLTRTLAVALAAGLPSFFANADHGDVLARVPADTQLIVSVSSLTDLLDGAQAFAQGINQPQALMGVGMARGMLSMPGIDAAGSAALVFNSFDDFDGPGEPPMVALIPVADYAALTQAMGGTGEGIEELDFNNNPVFIKDIGGGFAVIGPNHEVVSGFTPAEAAMGEHEAAMGAVGTTLSHEHTFMVNASVAGFADKLIEGWESGANQMRQMAQFGGVDAAQVEQQVEMMDTLVRTYTRDGQRSMLAFTADGSGLSFDLSSSFKEGSELAGYFANSSPASDTMAKLPGGEYIAAFAADLTAPGIRQLMLTAAEMGNANQMPGLDMKQFITGADSMAQVVGYNPAGLMAGLFPYTTMLIETDDANAYIAAYGEQLTGMNDAEANGVSMTTRFDAEATDVGGVQAHSYSITMVPGRDNPNAMQMQMMMPMLFGGGTSGPTGYVAAADDSTVVMTYTRKADFLGRAVAAARDGGDLVDNEMIAAQAARLPEDAFFVGYLDFGTIGRAALPMLGMVMPNAPAIAMPDALAPIAFSATADSGSVSFRTVVPMDVITTVNGIAQSFQQDGPGAGNPNEEPQF